MAYEKSPTVIRDLYESKLNLRPEAIYNVEQILSNGALLTLPKERGYVYFMPDGVILILESLLHALGSTTYLAVSRTGPTPQYVSEIAKILGAEEPITVEGYVDLSLLESSIKEYDMERVLQWNKQIIQQEQGAEK